MGTGLLTTSRGVSWTLGFLTTLLTVPEYNNQMPYGNLLIDFKKNEGYLREQLYGAL